MRTLDAELLSHGVGLASARVSIGGGGGDSWRSERELIINQLVSV
jgi:hypothetical protein